MVCDLLSCRIKFSRRFTRCCWRKWRVYQWCYQCIERWQVSSTRSASMCTSTYWIQAHQLSLICHQCCFVYYIWCLSWEHATKSAQRYLLNLSVYGVYLKCCMSSLVLVIKHRGMMPTTCHLRLAISLWVARWVQAKFMATANQETVRSG